MNRKAIQWLYEELPELVAKGIIPAESVDLIRNHYKLDDEKLSGKTTLTMFGIIGAMLVGLGVILIIAHNWDQLSRMARTLIVVGMLLGAQILVGATIWFKKENVVWTESVSTFLMIMIGAAIALIGQTYHITDDFSNFLLSWMLLSIPLVYLMGVTTPAILYLLGITSWVVSGELGDINKHFIWILLSFIIPYYWRLVTTDRYANKTVVVSWVLILCFYICFGAAFADYIEHLHMLIYAALFAVTYFLGIRWFDGPVKVWQQPFKTIGLIGCIGLSFLLTFKDIWSSLGRELYSIEIAEYLLVFSLLVFVIILGTLLVTEKRDKNLLFGGVPVVAGLGFALLYFDVSGINATVLFNGYMLLLSIVVILRGVGEESLGLLNIGMLMVAALILMRFLDISFSFVTRGLVFVVLGSCFLAANWIMVRRKKEVTK